MLYLSFGILLIYFLVNENINGKLNSILTKPVIDAVSKIGFSSYSIYIIHTFVIRMVEAHGFDNKLLNFALSFLISILAGIGMTYSFEKYFLGLRDKYFPARVG
jgi:peptidoglycan/LPS O-acetylase OafA/YrhL